MKITNIIEKLPIISNKFVTSAQNYSDFHANIPITKVLSVWLTRIIQSLHSISIISWAYGLFRDDMELLILI